MKKIGLSFVSLLALSCAFEARSQSTEEVIVTAEIPETTSAFTEAQRAEIKKIIGEYITHNPSLVAEALKKHREAEEKEALKKMEKALSEHKHKIFKNTQHPVGGNPKGRHSLVIFSDPRCGYCRKLEGDLPAFLETNKDVKVIFVDVPVMGERSLEGVKAMLAAHKQGKYPQMQRLVYSSPKLTPKKIMKKAKSLGLDTEKFKADMESKEIQTQLEENRALAESIGINVTPTLILNETQISSGYLSPEELSQQLKAPAESASGMAKALD